jgi:hypothetical protein
MSKPDVYAEGDVEILPQQFVHLVIFQIRLILLPVTRGWEVDSQLYRILNKS